MSDALEEVRFICGCGEAFGAAPAEIVDEPSRPWHPWAYFAVCPACGERCAQAWWEVNLLKAHAHATGPRSAEGKARVAQNFGDADERREPERTARTRFNGLKHGLYARTATYFPARPGGYARCQGCEHLETRSCLPTGACLKSTELLLRYHVAFERGDPEALSLVMAENQAALQTLFAEAVSAIVQDGGPRLTTPAWFNDKDGGFHLARYLDSETGETVQIMEIKQHPLLSFLLDMIKGNKISMQDLDMTPRRAEEEPTLPGFLSGDPAPQDMDDYRREQQARLEDLGAMIERGKRATQRDPVLIEHERVSGD